jgi:hypothetical protein
MISKPFTTRLVPFVALISKRRLRMVVNSIVGRPERSILVEADERVDADADMTLVDGVARDDMVMGFRSHGAFFMIC